MPRATSNRSTMSSTNGTPRATTPRSIRRGRKAQVNLIATFNAPVCRGVFIFIAACISQAGKSARRHLRCRQQMTGIACMPLRSPGPVHSGETLLTTYDVGEFGRCGDKVERRHSRYGDDRQIWNAFTHHPDDVETVGTLQEDINDRQVEFGIFELF